MYKLDKHVYIHGCILYTVNILSFSSMLNIFIKDITTIWISFVVWWIFDLRGTMYKASFCTESNIWILKKVLDRETSFDDLTFFLQGKDDMIQVWYVIGILA